MIEDHDNGDVFACLPDGTDRDIKTDGCVKILSVKDSSAEPTGFLFSADGRTAYVSIQHSDDSLMPLVDDYPTDDVLKITGFKVKKIRNKHPPYSRRATRLTHFGRLRAAFFRRVKHDFKNYAFDTSIPVGM